MIISNSIVDFKQRSCYHILMTNYIRQVNLINLLQKKSFFLLGPRATGKSYLAKEQLAGKAVFLNLLRSELFLRLTAAPWELENMIQAALAINPDQYIVIDEIQKVPQLLDEVHRLIEEKKWRFLLTGSSARKLKQGHANLLAGRAWTAHLYPLSYSEIPEFDLERYLQFGGLPAVYSSAEPAEELHAYVQTYLYEEIQAEGFVRKLPQFSRFLMTAALANGQMLNYTKIGNDAGVPASTIREYYSILEDTLIGFTLTPWTQSKKRKAVSTAKFYLFDTGVCNTLAQIKHLDRHSNLYGRSFEHWLALELNTYLSYKRLNDVFYYWRTTNQYEVDFIIDGQIAIEVKATKKVTSSDLKNLYALQEENAFKSLYLISHDPIEAKYQNIYCMPWQIFIERLWGNQIIEL